MRTTLAFLSFVFVSFTATGAFGQKVNYSDGVENLMEVKAISEDLARAIKLEWNHNSQAFSDARKLYNQTKQSVDVMINAFDARIRSGEKITQNDVQRHVDKAKKACDALSNHYNLHSAAGGTNALFGLDKIFVALPKLVNDVMNLLNDIKEQQIQARLNRMHKAFDPCALVSWEDA